MQVISVFGTQQSEVVKIRYINWKGAEGYRTIVPDRMWFGHTEFHPADQFILDAFDVEKGAPRSFAMRDIKEWEVIDVI